MIERSLHLIIEHGSFSISNQPVVLLIPMVLIFPPDKTSLLLDANEVIQFLMEEDFPAGRARELGVYLDVPQGRLSNFETDHPNNAVSVLMDVINYWIKNKEASQDKLATALKRCDHAMMAKKIQSKSY